MRGAYGGVKAHWRDPDGAEPGAYPVTYAAAAVPFPARSAKERERRRSDRGQSRSRERQRQLCRHVVHHVGAAGER